MEKFAHLHVHTQYSILDGQCNISKIFNKAVNDGMPGMAVTDHGNMFGIKEFFDIAKSRNAALEKEGKPRCKPIFGCEVYCARRSLAQRSTREDMSGWHLILLAKNKTGYHNLIKLVSIGWTDGFYMRPRIDHEQLVKYHEGLICCSACIAGEVPALFLAGEEQKSEQAIIWFKELFGEDYYLELQRHHSVDPNSNREAYVLQSKVNPWLVGMARKHGVKLICTNDVHFVDEENAEAHDHLLCLNTGKDLDDPTRMRYSKQEWFKTTAEMNEIFADIPEALANTVEIVDKVEEYNIENPPLMPSFAIPASFGTEEEYRQKFTEEQLFEEFTRDEHGNVVLSQEEAEKKIRKLGGYEKLYRIKFEADYLRHLTMIGAHRLYGDPLSEEVEERILFELHVMKTMGFPGYFLIVQDFINASRNELGVSVGPGRGSAAGSVVAYCLGITKLDPMKYDLLFERFLNPDRISLPDIDTDFDDDGRARVIEWVQDKYGADCVAHIITYGTMATKMVLKDVARVEKVPISQANYLAGLIPDRMPDNAVDEKGKPLKLNLKNCIKINRELQAACESQDPKIYNTMKYAQMLEGNVRGTGVHACGMIIGGKPITDVVPVSVVDDHGTKLLVTQYDGHVIESTGLIKMDFLGLKTLSIMNEALDNIKHSTGDVIDLDTIPIDDPLTYQLYCEGRTVGTFQFESPGMQKYLKELHPTVFGDLIAMNALYRPGPMDYIPSFIARKTGKEEIKYDIPCMEQYLKDTYGITVYQEQVMLLSRLLADFTRGESDALRTAMGKKKKASVDAMKPKFIEGGKRHGYDPKVLDKIWADWEKFASYAFNKSHAACYSWVAYQTAYLKAHYPAEYMAAVLSRNLKDINTLTKYMDECHKMGLKVKGPDVNLSRERYSVDKEGALRYGLAGIKSVGEGAAEAIVREREANGPYTDIFNFAERIDLSKVNRKCFEALVYSGAFDSLSARVARHQYIGAINLKESFLDSLVRYGQSFQADKQEAENSLFSDFGETAIEIAHPAIPEGVPMSTLERLNKEKEFVGLYLSAHPLDEYKFQLEYACNTKLAEFEHPENLFTRTEIVCGGIVTKWREGYTKKGANYGAITIEDYTGSYELMLWRDDFIKYRNFGKEGLYVLLHLKFGPKWFLHGAEPKKPDDWELQIQQIQQLDQVAETLLRKMTVVVDASKLSTATAKLLGEEIADANRDNDPQTSLFVQLSDPVKDYYVTMASPTRVHVSTTLIDFICAQDGLSCLLNDREVSADIGGAGTEEAEVLSVDDDLPDGNE